MDVTIALQRAVRGFALGTAALAARLGCSETSLNHKVSPTYPGAHCSPEEMRDIMELTGDHGALHALAAPLGYVLLPTPRVGDADGATAQALATSVREYAEFATEAAKGMLDGEVTDNELARLQREAAEAIAAINQLVRMGQQLNAQGKPAPLAEVRLREVGGGL